MRGSRCCNIDRTSDRELYSGHRRGLVNRDLATLVASVSAGLDPFFSEFRETVRNLSRPMRLAGRGSRRTILLCLVIGSKSYTVGVGWDMPRIPVSEILNDLRNGMGDHELTEKYQLSVKGLNRLMQKLVEENAIGHGELYEKSPSYRKFADRLASRLSPRMSVRRPIRAYRNATSQKGFVRDISENGVRIAGLNTTVGDVITLRLPLREVGATEPIEFRAVCRWSKIQGKGKKYVMCGFEITEISETARIRFDELTTLLWVESRGSDRSQDPVLDVQMPWQATGAEGTEPCSRQFSGKVDGVDILDVVQFLLLIGKTTVLHVTSPEGVESQLYLKKGCLVHADLGSLRGSEAFFACMNFPGGEFLVNPWCDPTDHTIHEPWELMLVEAARRRDESS
jgi:hypothetical protein